MDKAEKHNNGGNSKGTVIFTITVVLCAMLLFLVSDRGAEFIGKIYNKNFIDENVTTHDATEPDEETKPVLPTPEELMDALCKDHRDATAKLIVSDVGKAEYSLKRSDIQVYLTFMFSDGETDEIIFSYAPLSEPEGAEDVNSAISQYLAKKEFEKYEESLQDIRNIMADMLYVINGNEIKGIDTWLNLLDGAAQAAADSGKVNTFDMLGYSTKVYSQGKKDAKKVFISIGL